MKNLSPLLIACAFFVFTSSAAEAQDFFSVGVGKMNVLDSDNMIDFRTEYRWGEPVIWQIKPYVGLEANDEGSLYAVGGIYYDLGVAPHWYLTPSFGAGLWHDGDGPDLGSAVEFRSQLDISYEFENGHRLSTGFGHISNASIGDRNPGTEILNVQWHIPVGWWSGQ